MNKPTKTLKENKIQAYDLMSIALYIRQKYQLQLNSVEVIRWFWDNYGHCKDDIVNINTTINSKDKKWTQDMLNYMNEEFGNNIPIHNEKY